MPEPINNNAGELNGILSCNDRSSTVVTGALPAIFYAVTPAAETYGGLNQVTSCIASELQQMRRLLLRVALL